MSVLRFIFWFSLIVIVVAVFKVISLFERPELEIAGEMPDDL